MRSLCRGAVLLVAVVVAGCDRDATPITEPSTLDRAGVHRDVGGQATAAAQVAAGHRYACGLRTEGSIVCWGDPSFGIPSPPGGTFVQVESGTSTSCAVSAAGGIQCWGLNAPGSNDAPGLPPELTYKQVSIGRVAACAVRSDASIGCWGTTPASVIRDNVPAGSYASVSVGEAHACAITTGGALSCWGADQNNQLSNAPTAPVGHQFTQVDAGTVHTCALVDDGSIQCWGTNQSGQLNVPALSAGVSYTRVAVSSTFTDPSQAVYHSCALRSDGTAVCWGSNLRGQLNVPELPAGLTYTDVSAGGFFTCVVRSDGVVRCFGLNTSNETDVPPTLNLLKVPQAISFDPAVPTEAAAGSTLQLAPNAGTTLTLASTTPGVCTTSGTAVSFIAVGTCTFTADRAATAEFEAAKTVVSTVNVVPGHVAQTIVFSLPAEDTIGAKVALSATGGASGNPVTFTVLTPGTCMVANGKVSLTAIGDCTVAADQAGNAAYDAAPQVTATIAVRWPYALADALVAPPAVNRTKAGHFNSVIFSLGGDRGPNVFANDKATVVVYSCRTSPPGPGVGGPQAADPSLVTYDAKRRRYMYMWKSDPAWISLCGQLTLTLADGSLHTVLFEFK